MVCPHSVIRARYYDESALVSAPLGFASAPLAGRGFPDLRYTLQIGVEDCTGCELCVEVCPARSLEAAGVRAINMVPKAFAGAVDPVEDIRVQRDPLQDALLTQPDEAMQLLDLAQKDVDQRWRIYTSMAERWSAAIRRGQVEPGSHVAARVEAG